MLNKMKKILKSERGQITLVEAVILVAIVAAIAGLFGGGLQTIFGKPSATEAGREGAIGQLQGLVEGKFGEVLE